MWPMPMNIDQLKIVLWPEPILKQVATPVEAVTDEIRQIAEKMLELMHDAPGVGLAGPQVGLGLRMFVANETGDPEDDKVFINPVLRDPSEEAELYTEGCLSLPEITAQIMRPIGISIDALDVNGETFTLSSETLAARIWQHETDHLDGITIIKRMTAMDRLTNQRAIRMLEK